MVPSSMAVTVSTALVIDGVSLAATFTFSKSGEQIYVGVSNGLVSLSPDLVLDPIDGTRAFLAGTPSWGVLIAVGPLALGAGLSQPLELEQRREIVTHARACPEPP